MRFRPAAVRRTLASLEPSKATRPDGVPARVLKMCARELAPPLSTLFALCFTSQHQPSTWKDARVVPIYKRGSRSSPETYRPVSLLNILLNVMESIVNRSLINFLESNNILSKVQFGFRRGFGTNDLLTLLVVTIHMRLDVMSLQTYWKLTLPELSTRCPKLESFTKLTATVYEVHSFFG